MSVPAGVAPGRVTVRTAVLGWAAVALAGRPVVARVRPANVASARVAVRVGLGRAERLDVEGADGLDWIYVQGW